MLDAGDAALARVDDRLQRVEQLWIARAQLVSCSVARQETSPAYRSCIPPACLMNWERRRACIFCGEQPSPAPGDVCVAPAWSILFSRPERPWRTTHPVKEAGGVPTGDGPSPFQADRATSGGVRRPAVRCGHTVEERFRRSLGTEV
jgi:hypothetical protein